MTLDFCRWTSPCGCSFEEVVDNDTGEKKYLFTHYICPDHEPVAKQAPKLKAADIDKAKNDIIKIKREKWANNKTKNLEDFDNNKEMKRITNKVKAIGEENINQYPDVQALHDYYKDEKNNRTKELDDATKAWNVQMLLGLESEYALYGQEVYNKIITEYQTTETDEINPPEGG